MANTNEITAEELVEVLKFTPRTYKISMWGYGGEKVMGTATQEQWDYCMSNQVDLSDVAWDSDAAEEMSLDPDMLPFPPGSWYECDDMAHVNGVNRDAGTLQIEDENGNTIIEQPLDDFDGHSDDSLEWSCDDEAWIGSKKQGEIVFIGASNEKGTFFEGEINLTAPFDIRKLTLHYDDVDGEEFVNMVTYDGKDIDNWGGCTDGKSSDFDMVRLLDNKGNFERYEPEEKDWGTPECGPSPDQWERTPEFKFAKHKPVYVGWYSATWSHFGMTYRSAYWDGKEFGDFEYGKFKPVSGTVQTWSGYNWDTTDWANRPAEPIELVCDNKKCGWAGMGKDRIEDEELNDHCPECNGTEFSWIDYDADTKLGCSNRAKFCKEWDPVAALDKIVESMPATDK